MMIKPRGRHGLLDEGVSPLTYRHNRQPAALEGRLLSRPPQGSHGVVRSVDRDDDATADAGKIH
jgi:hypothetical protein